MVLFFPPEAMVEFPALPETPDPPWALFAPVEPGALAVADVPALALVVLVPVFPVPLPEPFPVFDELVPEVLFPLALPLPIPEPCDVVPVPVFPVPLPEPFPVFDEVVPDAAFPPVLLLPFPVPVDVVPVPEFPPAFPLQVEPVTANVCVQVPKPLAVTERPAIVTLSPGMQAGAW